MKRSAFVVALLSLVVSSCGLKVPATLFAGSELPGGEETPVGPGTKVGVSVIGGSDGPGDQPTSGPEVEKDANEGVDGPGEPGKGFFNSETEGVTKDRITLCSHVPITGAAPIPHSPDRFGQFYFDYVNAELGGVYGRKVTFKAYDDGYYPAGARAAVEKCARDGAFFYLGAAGTDQIVSVAKWAERKRVPYFHGPTSDRDLGSFHYNIFGGPTYEFQHRLLADYLVKRYGTNVDYGMIRVNSPYFDAGHDAYVDELKKFGITLSADRVVQKDESQFTDVLYDLSTKGSKGGAGVEVVNNFTTPNIWIKMLQQVPATYKPAWTAVSPVAGFNIVAAALKDANQKAVVFHHFNPSCNCTTYNTDLDESAAWAKDEHEFLRVFKKYSPEQNPPPDDFDYSAFVTARGLYRLLLALGPQPTRSKLWKLIYDYKETDAKAFPGCPADFARQPGSRRGAWDVNILELQVGKWKQIASCVDKV